MRRTIFAVAIFIFLGLVGFAWISKQKVPVAAQAVSSAQIVLSEDGFEPSEVTIKKGGTVTFTTTAGRPFWPASNLHPTHSIYSEFDPLRPLKPNEEWSFTFDRVGTHNFHDHIRAYFFGKVYVVN